MVVNDITYDIDNVDLEEQMLIQDIEEELDIEDQEEEQEEEKAQEEVTKTYYQTRKTLNAKNLDLDLAIEAEQHRSLYLWESNKDKQIYEGVVVHKFDNNTFLFNASLKGANDFKLRKFCLDNIKQIKK